ncbi:hypothetical protein [Burkholderia contaminans]|uniref:hypothetical protein n=1 Tax=Burkholderia contaminans TaxID=488447 RepID=UPI0011CFB562|nr:hypothetical protein [Burkholderia contaminans]
MSHCPWESPIPVSCSPAASVITIARFASADVRRYRECSGTIAAAIAANATVVIGLREDRPMDVNEIGGNGDAQ